jgi:limonene-1,2-epoxide hydrolase
MPIPLLAARGPDDIVKMLQILVEPLPGYERRDGALASNGADVMFEHSETWTFPSGEQGTLKIVSVHKVVDGKITLCKNYWDMATLMSFAPPNYFDGLGTGDTSWVFDATGLI